MLKDNILLITGGTGSFGQAVLNRFLEKKYLKNCGMMVLPRFPESPARCQCQHPNFIYYITEDHEIQVKFSKK